MAIETDAAISLRESCMMSSEKFYCDGRCFIKGSVLCDGKKDCLDGVDERNCDARTLSSMNYGVQPDVATSIVLPTILACILLVCAMLLGIKKCKQWELDRVVEMRRTRRIIQRLTNRLREKNFRTLQKARDLRKRVQLVQKQAEETRLMRGDGGAAPPLYDSDPPFAGSSPPPSYADAILDQYYHELLPRSARTSLSSHRSIFLGGL